jgi:histidine triad (HIT) family protein
MPIQLPPGDPCYFCEIIRGATDRWNVLEETELTVTLLNGRQFEVGQCIVVTRRHAPTLFDLTSAEHAAIMLAARRAASVMVSELDPDGVLLYQNNGVGSGQEVPHFHLHVVPRRPGSDWGFGPPHLARLEHAQRSAHADHTAVADDKRATAKLLREGFRRLEAALVLQEYDSAWPGRFAALAARVQATLADVVLRIEHVGSTAVPGLVAKPVIDLDVVVSHENVPEAIRRLSGLGYMHEGDGGIVGREAFRWPAGEVRHHLYLLAESAEELRRHVAFRDALRADPGLRERYAALKRSLAAQFPDDRNAYTDGKTAFIVETLRLLQG